MRHVLKWIVWILGGLTLAFTLLIFIAYKNLDSFGKLSLILKTTSLFHQGSTEKQWLLNKAIETVPSYAGSYMEKSVAFNKRGLYAEGFGLLNKAVDLDPKEHLGYRGYVKLYMTRDFQGALADFTRLDSLTPNFIDAPWGEDLYHVKGLAYLLMDSLALAKENFLISIRSTTEEFGVKGIDVQTYYYLAMTEFKLKQYSEALDHLELALINYNKYSEAYFLKSKILMAINEETLSREVLKNCTKYLELGYKYENPYYEIPFQIYISDVNK